MSGNDHTDPLKPANNPALKAETGWANGASPAGTSTGNTNRAWPEIRRLLNGKAFDIQGDQRSARVFLPHGPAQDIPFSFTYLGSGTNKHAVLIDGTSWVLLCGNPVTGEGLTKKSFEDEVDALIGLAAHGVPVPRPFGSNVSRPKLLFEIKLFFDGHEKVVPAFLEEYLQVSGTKFAEMPKEPQARQDFARSVILAGKTLPKTIWKTVEDLNAIGKEMERNPWNDFQLMFDRQTGRVIVFDPMPFPTQASEATVNHDRDNNLKVLEQWLDDIDQATEKAVKRWRTAPAT